MAEAVAAVYTLRLCLVVLVSLTLSSADDSICFHGCQGRRSESCAVEHEGFHKLWREFHQPVFTGHHALKDALEANLMCADCGTAGSTDNTPLCLWKQRFVVVKGHAFPSLTDEVLQPFQQVVSLSLVDANLTDVRTGALARLQNLEFLGIVGNKLPVLKSGSFSLPKPRWLSLRENKIHTIESRTFEGSGHLTLLDLHGNDLHVVMAGFFGGLTSLTSLDLGSNKIKYMAPHVFESLPSLESLVLDNNELATVKKDWFTGLSRLEVLALAKNRIAAIEHGSMKALPALRSLELSGNQLAYVHSHWFNDMKSLKKLSLADNRIIAGAVDSLPGFAVDLSCNPLRCTCARRWLHGINFVNNSKPICEYPPLWRGQNLQGDDALSPCPLAALPTKLSVHAFPTSLISAPPVSFHYTYTVTCRVFWERQPQLAWRIEDEQSVTLPNDTLPGRKVAVTVSMATCNVTATVEHTIHQTGWICRGCIVLQGLSEFGQKNASAEDGHFETYLGKTVSTAQVRTHRVISSLDCVVISDDTNFTVPTAPMKSQPMVATTRPSPPPPTTADHLSSSRHTTPQLLLATVQPTTSTTRSSPITDKQRGTDKGLSCALIALLVSSAMGLLTCIPSLCYMYRRRKPRGLQYKATWHLPLALEPSVSNQMYYKGRKRKVSYDVAAGMLTPTHPYDLAHEYETCPSPAPAETRATQRHLAGRKSLSYAPDAKATDSDCGMYRQKKDAAVPADPNDPPLETYKPSDDVSEDDDVGHPGRIEREPSRKDFENHVYTNEDISEETA